MPFSYGTCFNDCIGEGSIFIRISGGWTKYIMEKRLSELIDESDLIVVGIGNEWNWIRSGLKSDPRYNDILNYTKKEGFNWLLPVVEFEYGYYNNNDRIDVAYKGLRKLIGDKKYFLICEMFLQDALLNGFETENCVYPCGNFRYLQTPDIDEPLIEAIKADEFMGLVSRIHNLINEREGLLHEGETFYKPFYMGKELYLNQKRLEYSNIKYNESAYFSNWDKYTRYLADTINKKLLILELGVSLDYPTVIRWPFEKMTFINKGAHLVRVHEKLFHHTPEIADKTDSVSMNSVDYIMQESEGL